MRWIFAVVEKKIAVCYLLFSQICFRGFMCCSCLSFDRKVSFSLWAEEVGGRGRLKNVTLLPVSLFWCSLHVLISSFMRQCWGWKVFIQTKCMRDHRGCLSLSPQSVISLQRGELSETHHFIFITYHAESWRRSRRPNISFRYPC